MATVSAETAWRRSLERLLAGAAPEDDLDRAIAGALPRGDVSALPADGIRLVLSSSSIGDAAALPDEVLIGWAAAGGDAEPPAAGSDGYCRLIVDLLEAGFRPVRERTVGGPPALRVVRARRDGYRVRGYRPGDELAILGLFRDCFGQDLSLERWRWKYVDNPCGGPRISLAFAPGGELVCQYCAYPVRWRGLPPSAPAESHQVGDTMTRRSARSAGRGPTSILARTSRHFYLTHCAGRVAFNYGFNTGNIQKFSNRFLGVRQVEDAPYRELSPTVRLRRSLWRGPRYDLLRITGRSEVDAEFDALFERVSGRYGLLVERSSEYLRWRYVDCPAGGPELLAAYRRGRLAAWAAVRRLADRVEWGDALVDPAERPAMRALLAEMRTPGLPVVGWFSGRPGWLSKELDALGLVRRPEPQGLVTGLAPFVLDDAVSLMQKGYYTKADSDLF